MKKLGLLLVFAASLSVAQQSKAPVQLTQVPPKPTCIPNDLFNSPICQKELPSSQATAPLQVQIGDLNKPTADQQAQIKSLHEQVQTATVDASPSSITAHTIALQEGVGIGVGATLLLFGLIFGIWQLMQSFSVTKKPEARAASA